jgi:hypothetical protein
MPVALLEEIRATPEDAYARVLALPDMLDLDRAWQRLAALMDAAKFPLNPITAGELFPDERHSFGRDGDSRALSPEQVAAAAAHLIKTPFSELAPHLRPLLDAEPRFPLPDPRAPLLEPLAPLDPESYRVDEETERAIRKTLEKSYSELVSFFREAAERGECTVFWAG